MKKSVTNAVKLMRVFSRMWLKRPTFLSFNVTNLCNERCPMCSVWRTPSRELTLSEMEGIFRELKRFGIMIIEVSGGEPFLRKDIFHVFGMLDRLGLLYTVTTNGTVMPGEAGQRLKGLKGLLQLAVSLDSLDSALYARLRGADTLSEALSTIEELCATKQGFPLKINFTMSRLNYRETFAMLDFAKQRGLFLSVFPVNQGSGFLHRSSNALLTPNETERQEMAETFRILSRLRKNGEPLWEYSRFYDLSAEYVLGRPVGPCDAGRLYLDLHADGTLSVCVDQEGFADLLREDVASALQRIQAQKQKIAACAANSPCCYTCTYSLSVTADHIADFVLETIRVRGIFPFCRRDATRKTKNGTRPPLPSPLTPSGRVKR